MRVTSMLRAIWLTAQNEARLLVKDPIVLFMLLFAPVVIITVAGYSLGSLYGGAANSIRLPVVNLDKGQVADGIIRALRKERNLTLEMLADPDEARRLVSRRDRTPIAIGNGGEADLHRCDGSGHLCRDCVRRARPRNSRRIWP